MKKKSTSSQKLKIKEIKDCGKSNIIKVSPQYKEILK